MYTLFQFRLFCRGFFLMKNGWIPVFQCFLAASTVYCWKDLSAMSIDARGNIRKARGQLQNDLPISCCLLTSSNTFVKCPKVMLNYLSSFPCNWVIWVKIKVNLLWLLLQSSSFPWVCLWCLLFLEKVCPTNSINLHLKKKKHGERWRYV